MIKNGQIFVAIFRALLSGIAGITTSRSCRTDECPNTIGGKGIIVIREIPFMGPTPTDRAAFHPSKATKSPIPFRYLARVHAQWAGAPICRAWRILRQFVGLATTVMHPFDFWPDFVKVMSNTACTEADHIRNRLCTLITISAGSHVPNLRCPQRCFSLLPTLLNRTLGYSQLADTRC